MVVCRYFLEGRCKYGDTCRYEHPADALYPQEEEYYEEPQYQDYQGGYRGGYRQEYSSGHNRYPGPRRSGHEPQGRGGYGNRFSSPSYTPPPRYDSPQHFHPPAPEPARGSTDAQILEDVYTDVFNMWAKTDSASTIFERGKIWPFSVYTYCSADGTIKTDPLFGLTDHSPEELRMHALTAKRDASTWNQYVAGVTSEGNSLRTKLAEICGACTKEHLPAAKELVNEVRQKAAQHETRTRLAERPAFLGSSSSVPAAYQTHGQSPATPMNQLSQAPGLSNGLAVLTSQPHGVYSDTNMLTAEEFFQFASPEFTQGKIPYRPPPRNLC